MDEKNDLIKVGKYDLRYNELLSIDIEELDIFRSKGLPAVSYTHLTLPTILRV